MKTLFLKCFVPLALAASCSFAHAEEPSLPPPTADWTGVYVGAHLGGAWARQKAFENDGEDLVITKDLGFGGGGQLGLNWQFGRWVAGLEGGLGGLDVENSEIFGGDDLFESDYGFYGTATGRLGYAGIPRSLLFLKGGFAFADIDNFYLDVLNQADQLSLDETRIGWAVGGGFERAFNRRWSAEIEYLYMDFGDTSGIAPDNETITFDNQVHTLMFGVNYRWGRDAEPLN